MSTGHSGRLELTWTNKHKCLLAHDTAHYEWVDPADYRVSEVRLLHDVTTIGSVQADRNRAKDNLLIRGDALCALTSLRALPEFAKEYAGKVRLVYIDPPFNTGQVFEQYDDGLEHSVWLTMLRDRLQQVKTLLSPQGSVWVHLDDVEVHRARCVLDEVFGSDKFVTTIVWQKRTTKENRPAFSPSQDYIHVYAPAGPVVWKKWRNKLRRTKGGYSNPDNDPKGPWASIPFTAKGKRKNQQYTIVTPTGVSYTPPFKNRCWAATEPEYEKYLAANLVYFPRGGDGKPRIKQYPWEDEGVVPETWWTATDCGTNDEAKRHIHELFPGVDEFSTPKPEQLLERIIHIATNPGDIVLDCFLGSGTTAAVAHKMERRWAGVEWSPSTLSSYVLPRMEQVVSGQDTGGISDDIDWTGGGGFRVLDVAPSMFEEEDGNIALANWATNGKLGEATAAQLGYEHCDEPPFCGRKGRSKLAVVDGLVSEGAVNMLVGALSPTERITICGTSVDPAARELLRDLRRGSTLRKIPASILAAYRDVRQTSLTRVLEWQEAFESSERESKGSRT